MSSLATRRERSARDCGRACFRGRARPSGNNRASSRKTKPRQTLWLPSRAGPTRDRRRLSSLSTPHSASRPRSKAVTSGMPATTSRVPALGAGHGRWRLRDRPTVSGMGAGCGGQLGADPTHAVRQGNGVRDPARVKDAIHRPKHRNPGRSAIDGVAEHQVPIRQSAKLFVRRSSDGGRRRSDR
jgi:hypothetical protein